MGPSRHGLTLAATRDMLPVGTLLRLTAAAAATAALMACASAEDDGSLVDHDEDSDFVEVGGVADGKADVAGIPTAFDRHLVLSDELYRTTDAVDAAGLQTFFEDTPYHTRSWLADAEFDGHSAAELLVQVAHEHEVNPLLLLVRMQVEQALVSKTVRPSQARIDAALGCGCPDGRGCSASYRGFGRQLTCAAETMNRWYQASIDGTGPWRMGRARNTLDPRSVTPRSHATASMYAYTPWVLVGRGGNWLTWNVLRRYAVSLDERGLLSPP